MQSANVERRRCDRLLDAVEEQNVKGFRLTPDGLDVDPVIAPVSLLAWYSMLGGQRDDIYTLRQLHDAVLELEGGGEPQKGWPRSRSSRLMHDK